MNFAREVRASERFHRKGRVRTLNESYPSGLFRLDHMKKLHSRMVGCYRVFRRVGLILAVMLPNVFLVLIQPAPNALGGSYYEILTVTPNFLVYYLTVLILSLVLLTVSVARKSSESGLTAFALLGSSLFMPRLVNFDWLTYRDILLHGRWISASYVHFAAIFPYSQWPGAWALWLIVCRVLFLDPVYGSLVMLTMDWMLRLAATIVLAKVLVRQSGLGERFAYVVAILMLALFQNQLFRLNTYFDSAIGQSLSILIFAVLLRAKWSRAHVVVVAALTVCLVITQPFYAAIMSSAVFVFLLAGYLLQYRNLDTRPEDLHVDALLAFLVISILWIMYYVTEGTILPFLSLGPPRSILLRTQTLGVLEPLPFLGVIARQMYKYVVLPATGVLFLAFMLRGKLPKVNKLVACAYSISATVTWLIFAFIPGFEGRIISFTLFGLSMIAGLEISKMMSNRSRMQRFFAGTLLILLISVPFFLTLETPIYSLTITQSAQATLAFSSRFPNQYASIFPMSVYLQYIDPYGNHQHEITASPWGVTLISPRPGLTFVWTLPPGQLSANTYEMALTGFVYSDAWNLTDRVYVSGGIIAYYEFP